MWHSVVLSHIHLLIIFANVLTPQPGQIPSTGPCQSWPPNNPHTLDCLYYSLSSTCSWRVVSALAPLSCGCRRIIQVLHTDGGWGETPHIIVKRFGCTTIHNKALYKCIIHSFIHSFIYSFTANRAILFLLFQYLWRALYIFIWVL